MQLIAILFYVCLATVFYTYVGYPLMVGFLAALKRKANVGFHKTSDTFEPDVSLVIPCYNEGYYLQEKVKNSLALNYPKQKLDIVFITDGSDDNSVNILTKAKGISLLHEAKRSGKAAAENRAMQHIKSPFVVFSDANTMLNKDAIKNIVKHFFDEQVGAVSGEKRVITDEKNGASVSGEGFYWKFESWLKKQDSDLHNAVGGAGELIAFRTTCFTPLEEDTILDDFVASMRIAINGYKVVYEPNAYAEEYASANVGEETKRKIRIAAGAWQALFRLPKALNVFSQPMLTFIYISHKVMRWSLSPVALFALVPLGYLMHFYVGGWFTLLWILQQTFYFLTLLGKVFEYKKIKFKLAFIPYYFVVTNWCMIAGFIRYVSGKQQVKWEKAGRMQ